MHLEKANSQSGEAGLAGWISSNDVTLFTVVLIVAVAVFLQANLIKGSKKNKQLASENTLAHQEITQISSELDQTQRQLDETRNELTQKRQELETTTSNLQATRDELTSARGQRDELKRQAQQLEQQLTTTRVEITDLNAALDSLKIDRDSMVAARDKLKLEKGDLTQQYQRLEQDKTKLNTDIQQLAAKLAERLADLEDLQKERDLLQQRATALDERVERLEQQLGDQEEDLVELKKTSEADLAELQKLLTRSLERHKTDQTATAGQLQAAVVRASEAASRADEASQTAEAYLDRLRRAAVYVRDMDAKKKLLALQVEALKTQLANALDDLEGAEKKVAEQRVREAMLNRELVGLRGDLKRVAILFDSSGSMSQSGRWNEVQRIASTWLDHLEVDECVLIVFSSDVVSFPSDGSLLPVSGSEGRPNRQRLMEYLKAVKPEGWTNTLAAMQKAYQYENLDTILLFSDGAPTTANSGTFDTRAVQQIYNLCRQHPDIPINAIGLGNYFDQDFATFLRTMATLTNGTFIGR